MKVLINYADRKYYNSQKKNSQTGRNIGKFDKVIEYNRNILDKEFITNNKFILNNPRGAGYWLWKPYIILKTLNTLNDGDYLFYCDAGSHFINSIDYLINFMEKIKQDILPFELNHIEKIWTKRDLFLILKCDGSRYYNSKQRVGGFQLIKKNANTLNFYREYLKIAQRPRAITNIPNKLGKPNYPGFKEHRHDQSIFSLLTKKYGYKAYRDPSQFGGRHKVSNKVIYPQIIELTRNKK